MKRETITDAVYAVLHDHVGALIPERMQLVAGLVADRVLAEPEELPQVNWQGVAERLLKEGGELTVKTLTTPALNNNAVIYGSIVAALLTTLGSAINNNLVEPT